MIAAAAAGTGGSGGLRGGSPNPDDPKCLLLQRLEPSAQAPRAEALFLHFRLGFTSHDAWVVMLRFSLPGEATELPFWTWAGSGSGGGRASHDIRNGTFVGVGSHSCSWGRSRDN